MIKDERTLNSYALRNALLLAAYGVYGILLLPRVFTLFKDPFEGGLGWVIRIVVLVLYICYIFLGMTAMMTKSKIKSNHHLINVLFFVIFLDCTFLGFYLTSKNGFESLALIALSLSSILIVGVIIYYFTIFQIKRQEINALRTMSATLLFFSGGGEIFFHHMPYVNTIMGWFMIWMSLNGPGRPLWKSFALSLVGSFMFFLPRHGIYDATLLDYLRNVLIENQIPPLYSIYVTFGLVFLIVVFMLKIKLRSIDVDSKNSNDVFNTDL
jgi:hypothetical protein